MEAYAILAIVGIGTWFSGRGKRSRDARVLEPLSSRAPVQGYEPELTLEDAREAEASAAQRMARAAPFVEETGVVDPRTRLLAHDSFSAYQGPVYSELAGRELSGEDFRHLNEQPFFGARVTQPMSDRYSSSRVETFTGAAGLGTSAPKQEVEPFFAPVMGAAYTAGDPGTARFFEDRLAYDPSSGPQKNVLPFEQVRVGPGVGQGYTATPAGGFTQPQDRQYVLPPSVDELRSLAKPKALLEGRVIPGSAPEQRGLVPELGRHGPSTTFDIGERGLVATAGPTAARALRPSVEHALGTGNRQLEPVGYVGASGAGRNEATPVRPEFGGRRRALHGGALASGAVQVSGPGAGDPRAMATAGAVLVPNERGSGAVVTDYLGGAGALVGGLMADPLSAHEQRLSGREGLAESKRMFGPVQPQIPGAGPAFDTTDRARTTLRETMIHDERSGNLSIAGGAGGAGHAEPERGHGRATVREHVAAAFGRGSLSVAGPGGLATHPGSVPRATTREITHAARVGAAGSSGFGGGAGAYEIRPDEAAVGVTNRDTMLSGYQGAAGATDGFGGYGAAQAAAEQSQRAVMPREVGHVAHAGPAGSAAERPMSYEMLYNTAVRTVREEVSRSRVLAPVGSDQGAALERAGGVRPAPPTLQTARVAGGEYAGAYNAGAAGAASSQRLGLPQDDRLDDDLLAYLASNPFVTVVNAPATVLPAGAACAGEPDPSRAGAVREGPAVGL